MKTRAELWKRNSKVIIICSLIIMVVIYIYEIMQAGPTVNSKKTLTIRLRGPLTPDDPKVIQILKISYLHPPSTSPYALSKDPLYRVFKKGYSWTFTNTYLKSKLFSTQRGGFFVEAGALDGEFFSNTLWLEQQQGWTGLLIEPDPENYRELLTKNRKAWTSNTCLSSKPYPKQTILVSRRRESFVGKNTTWLYRGSTHEIGYTLPPSYNAFMSYTTSDYVRVQCFPFWTYLLALNRTNIDMISLDIQGAEMDVIRTLPLDKIRVRAFVVEYYSPTSSDLPKFLHFFHSNGYKLIGCSREHDFIFIRRDEEVWKTIADITKVSSCS